MSSHSSEYDDSSYVGEDETEPEVTQTDDEQKHEHRKKLTQQQLDDLWGQLSKINESQKLKDEKFNIKQVVVQDNAPLTEVPEGFFHPSTLVNFAVQSDAFDTMKYNEKLQKFQPKIVTIHETRKFWQFYKNQLNAQQLTVLQRYVQSQDSFLQRKSFLEQVNAKKAK